MNLNPQQLAAYAAMYPAYAAYFAGNTTTATTPKGGSNIPAGVNATEQTPIWMGEIENWMDESFVFSLFATSQPVSVKIMRDKKNTNPNAIGYAFIYFPNAYIAQHVIETYNNRPIPGHTKSFKLNWGQKSANKTGNTSDASTTLTQPNFHSANLNMNNNNNNNVNTVSKIGNEAQGVFVGDLAPEVTQQYLQSVFQYFYPSVYSSRVVTDPKTSRPKGFGFVYFGNDQERTRAMTEMQGYQLAGRAIKVGAAQKKDASGSNVGSNMLALSNNNSSGPEIPPLRQQFNNNNNNNNRNNVNRNLTTSTTTSSSGGAPPAPPNDSVSTVFIGGLDPLITQDMIRNVFAPYGAIMNIKIPNGKSCAFVDFETQDSAARAIAENQKLTLGRNEVRLSWGKVTNRTNTSTDATQLATSSTATNTSTTTKEDSSSSNNNDNNNKNGEFDQYDTALIAEASRKRKAEDEANSESNKRSKS